jgi:hypothetical protein
MEGPRGFVHPIIDKTEKTRKKRWKSGEKKENAWVNFD